MVFDLMTLDLGLTSDLLVLVTTSDSDSELPSPSHSYSGSLSLDLIVHHWIVSQLKSERCLFAFFVSVQPSCLASQK